METQQCGGLIVDLTNRSTETIAILSHPSIAREPKTAQIMFLSHFSLVSVIPSDLGSPRVLKLFLKTCL